MRALTAPSRLTIFLLPALALVIEQFPFEIAGFHSDNGSEYINGRVAKLLEKF